MKPLTDLFTRHPQSVGETYGEHAAFAGQFGLRMVICGLACMVHAVFPFFFVKTASACVRDLHGQITEGPRGETTPLPPAAVRPN
ncbi:MAG: DUF6356 family protein [Rhodospirillaceae bacterium]|nr:DUF6356 family protein [Rhodospirillaceae bacterium]